jgi:hypothetical protein
VNPIKKKLSGIMAAAAIRQIDVLKEDPVCAEECARDNIEEAIQEDVDRLVEDISFGEGARIVTLSMQLDSATGDKAVEIGKELSHIAEQIISRVEDRSGPLNFSISCRKMYMEFGGV